MKVSHLLLPAFATVAIGLSCLTAEAQTGPIGGGSQVKGGGNQSPPIQTSKMTPERLQQYLQQKGYQAQVQTFQNGGKLVTATIEKDGWRYVVEFDYDPTMQSMFLAVPLGTVPGDVSAGQLTAVLQATHQNWPYHFSINNVNQKLYLNGPNCFVPTMTEQFLEQELDRHLSKVRATQQAWSFVR